MKRYKRKYGENATSIFVEKESRFLPMFIEGLGIDFREDLWRKEFMYKSKEVRSFIRTFKMTTLDYSYLLKNYRTGKLSVENMRSFIHNRYGSAERD